MKKRYVLLTALIVLGSVPMTGIAASPAAEPSSQFNAIDTNKDGVITKNEAQASADLKARFEQLDSDRNGQISLSEWQAGSSLRGAAGVSGASRFGTADIPVMIP